MGELRVTGVRYSLSSLAIGGPVEDSYNIPAEPHPAVSAVSMLGRLDLAVQGPRMNSNKAEKTSIVYGPDQRLNLVVVHPMPLLEVGALSNTIKTHKVCRHQFSKLSIQNNVFRGPWGRARRWLM